MQHKDHACALSCTCTCNLPLCMQSFSWHRHELQTMRVCCHAGEVPSIQRARTLLTALTRMMNSTDPSTAQYASTVSHQPFVSQWSAGWPELHHVPSFLGDHVAFMACAIVGDDACQPALLHWNDLHGLEACRPLSCHVRIEGLCCMTSCSSHHKLLCAAKPNALTDRSNVVVQGTQPPATMQSTWQRMQRLMESARANTPRFQELMALPGYVEVRPDCVQS